MSFSLRRRESLALVGESGCGKSLAALAILRLLPPPPSCVLSGEIWFNGKDLVSLDEPELRRLRGRQLAMSFQEPETALDPSATIGRLVTEPILAHALVSRGQARAKAEEVLALVGVPNPKRVLESYPYELSGGTRQRVGLAMALSCEPQVLIADQPTSGVDPTTQAQLFEVLLRIQQQRETSLLIITHNLSVVAEHASRVVVMFAGQVVERGTTQEILNRPLHPYTLGLLASVPPRNPSGPPQERRLPVRPPQSNHASPTVGCRFFDRCELRRRLETDDASRCQEEAPPLRALQERLTRCHFAEELAG